MCSASDVQKIIQSVAGAYRSVFGNDVVQIILYGSYARGDFTDDSDLDLAAIVVGPGGAAAEAETGLGYIF